MKNLLSYRFIYPFIITILIICCNCTKSYSTLDSNEVYKVVLKVGHFNFDRALDTLIGCASKTREFYPAYIYWGKDPQDTTIADSLKVRYTKFVYPSWSNLRVRCSVDQINPDSLCDIIFVIWGKKQIDSTTTKDTATSIVVFGTRGFDTISTANLSGLPIFQSSPFVAAKYRRNYEYTDAKKRDLSEITSYIVKDHSYSDTSGYEDPINTDIPQPQKDLKNIKVYPNPSIYYIDIEVNEIPPGEYQIKIYDFEGSLKIEEPIKTFMKGDIAQRINTDKLPNGSYLLVVSSGKGIIGKYQLIILH